MATRRRWSRAAPGITLGALLALALGATVARAETAWVASTTIRVIDLERGEQVGRLTVAPDQVVREITFDRAGDRAWVASMGGLFEVDARTLSVVRTLSERPTCSVALAEGGGVLYALHLQPAGDGRAARERGETPTVTLARHPLAGGGPPRAVELAGHPLRVRCAADGSAVWVLDTGGVRVLRLDATLAHVEEIRLDADVPAGTPVMCTELGLSPDGDRLAVVRSTADGAALVLVDAVSLPGAGQVHVEDLGPGRRARGAAFTPDGAAVWVTAIGHLTRVVGRQADPDWRDVGHEYSLVAVSPSGRSMVLATPTFDAGRGTGGVLITDAEGRPLQVVELTDVSPYTLAIQP